MTNAREAYNEALGNLFSLDNAAPEEAIGAVLEASEAVFSAVEATTLEEACRLTGDATRLLVGIQPLVELAEYALDFQLAEVLRSYRSAAFQLLRRELKRI